MSDNRVLRIDYANGFRLMLAGDSASGDDMAPVFLERECIDGTHKRVGSVDLQANQGWQAAIAANQSAFRIVGRDMPRMFAISALWQHRGEAFVAYCSL